jgi:hypothetical protein
VTTRKKIIAASQTQRIRPAKDIQDGKIVATRAAKDTVSSSRSRTLGFLKRDMKA